MKCKMIKKLSQMKKEILKFRDFLEECEKKNFFQIKINNKSN